ncbi:MAG: hypothetical protein U0572_14070 [Phycisphaerales bacterium]
MAVATLPGSFGTGAIYMPIRQRFVPSIRVCRSVLAAGAVTGAVGFAGVLMAAGPGNAQATTASPAATTTAPNTAPKTAPASTSSTLGGHYVRAMDWELDFRPGALRMYTDAETGKAYWYFTYKVINRTGKDRMWAPRLELFTDGGAIELSGRSVPTEVTRNLLRLLGNPLMQDQNQVIGEIHVGEENAKEGLVVWPAADLQVTEFTVFVAGASGKVRKVADPRTGQPRAERWTIRFNYLVPGDPVARGSSPVQPASVDEDLKDGADRRTDYGVWLWR